MNKKHINLTDDDLKKLHNDLLVILKEIDRICIKNNINYYLSDGTLLGAIRHKGFIPWDDDADIQMLRKDYDKFCKICEKELGSEFFLQSQETDKKYNWCYAKLRLSNTDFVRSGQEHLEQKTGIFIDIFPLDNIPDSKFTQKSISMICRIIRKILWSSVGMVSKEKKIIKIWYRCLNYIPRHLSISVFNLFSKKFNNKETKYLISNNLDYYQNKTLILEKEWFKEYIRVDFEDLKLNVPKHYHNVLQKTYGDYMKLPPKDKQVGHCYASYIKFLDGTELKI